MYVPFLPPHLLSRWHGKNQALVVNNTHTEETYKIQAVEPTKTAHNPSVAWSTFSTSKHYLLLLKDKKMKTPVNCNAS